MINARRGGREAGREVKAAETTHERRLSVSLVEA
jgi:hypothetical protein